MVDVLGIRKVSSRARMIYEGGEFCETGDVADT